VTRRAAALAGLLALGTLSACREKPEDVRLPGLVVESEYHLTGAVVRGATRSWWKDAKRAARYGDPLPVGITMYCLQGTTRRGRYVRSGIVAADPHYFPLAGFIELYAGRQYLGRFLVDDTGKRIKGARIDVWTSNCGEASHWGIQRGTAVRVRRDLPPQPQQAGATAHSLP